MKVSIITVVYNNKEHIKKCIQSVLNQNYNDIEYIVIDGNSTDGTKEVIKPFLNRIDYLISEPDQGLYDALNKGINLATGEVVGILHSDDIYYELSTIQRIMDTFKETGVDIVYANGMFVDKKQTDRIKRVYKSKPFNMNFLKYGWIPLHTTIFVKREVYLTYGLHDKRYKISADYEISLRWFKNQEIKKYYLDEWVVCMRLGGMSTNPKLQRQKSSEDLLIMKKHNLNGLFTLLFKIGRKIPQYLLPKIKNY